MASTTENDVKKMILDVSELPGTIDGIDENAALSDLNFNDNMCNDLAQRLNRYVKSIEAATSVNNSEITKDMTVQQVMDLIKKKLGS